MSETAANRGRRAQRRARTPDLGQGRGRLRKAWRCAVAKFRRPLWLWRTPQPARIDCGRLNCYVQPPHRSRPTPRRSHMTDLAKHKRMANAIRALAMDAVEKAKSGHPGMPMGMADVATVLFTRYLKFDPAAPHWPDRDRFVLSAGHGSMLLYALLYLTGYDGDDARRAEALPPARLEDAGPSRELHDARRRDDHRPARPGRRQRRSAWRSPSACSRPSSATTSSTTTPTSSAPTAT